MDPELILTEPITAGLYCAMCSKVAMEPLQHGECGKLFCKKCLDEYGRNEPCHHCMSSNPEYFEDNRSRGEINALEMKCKYTDRDCPWRGTVGTYITSHDEVCKKKPIPCPNDCGRDIQRQGIKRHTDHSCPMEEVSCKYMKLGCNTRVKRRDIGRHEQDNEKQHLCMAMDSTVQLQEAISSVNLSPITFQVTQYRTKRERKEIFTSPSFYTSPNGYHMAIQVHANGYSDGEATHVSVFALMLEGKYDSKLRWPFQGKITFVLLNQHENTNHHEMTLDVENGDDIRVGSSRGCSTFIPITTLARSTVQNTRYLKEDTLYFKVAVDIANYKPWLECTAK